MFIVNTINRQVFDFTCASEMIATQIQRQIVNYITPDLHNVIDQILTEEFDEDEFLVIDQIEIDLGNVDISNFGSDEMIGYFKRTFKEKILSLRNKKDVYKNDAELSFSEVQLRIITAFLLHGTFPWWTDKTAPVSIDEMLKKLIHENPEAIKSFLIDGSKTRSVINRLAEQFKPSTRAMVNKLVPDLIGDFYKKMTFDRSEYELNIKELSPEFLEKLQVILNKKAPVSRGENKNSDLNKLLKYPYTRWKSVLGSLNILSIESIKNLEKVFNNPKTKWKIKIKEAIDILKRLSVFHIEFLLHYVSVFDSKEVTAFENESENDMVFRNAPLIDAKRQNATETFSADLNPDAIIAKTLTSNAEVLSFKNKDESESRTILLHEDEAVNASKVIPGQEGILQPKKNGKSESKTFFANEDVNAEIPKPIREEEIRALKHQNEKRIDSHVGNERNHATNPDNKDNNDYLVLSRSADNNKVDLKKDDAKVKDVLVSEIFYLEDKKERSKGEESLAEENDTECYFDNNENDSKDDGEKKERVTNKAWVSNDKNIISDPGKIALDPEESLNQPGIEKSKFYAKNIESPQTSAGALVKKEAEKITFKDALHKNEITAIDFISIDSDKKNIDKDNKDLQAAKEPGEKDPDKELNGYDYKRKVRIKYIQNKLRDWSDGLYYRLKELSDPDLLILETHLKQIQGVLNKRRKTLDAIVEHPHLLEFDLLKILTASVFIKPSQPRKIEALIREGKVDRHPLSVLFAGFHSFQLAVKSIVNDLSRNEAMVWNDVIEKRSFETESEKRLVKRVLKRLPEASIRLLLFFTELSEKEMKEFSVSYKKDAYISNEEKLSRHTFGNYTNEPQKIHIENAGLCIVATYFSALFNNLKYLEKHRFKNKAIAARALYLIQYVATGKTKSAEYLLQFNKLLCGFQIEENITSNIRLSKKEKMESDDMVRSVIENWETIKNTSVNGFRESFLQRRGILIENELSWTLQVERKGHDILLSTIAWGFGIIKLPWMKKHIQVEW